MKSNSRIRLNRSEIRKITAKDKPQVLDICSRIWEGEDYLPEVFDEWVKDGNGIFAGLWDENTLIGFGRMHYLTEADVWLEGLRKDPRCKLTGVGEKLARYFLSILKEKKDLRSIRFSTYVENKASIIINEKLGFERIRTFSIKNREMKSVRTDPVTVDFLTSCSLDDLVDRIESSRYLQLSSTIKDRFLSQGWVIHPFSRELLADFHKKGHYYLTGSGSGVVLYSPDIYSNSCWINLLDASDRKTMKILLQAVHRQAAILEKKEIEILIPECYDLLSSVLEEEGFASWDNELDFFLYELPLEKLERF